MGITFVQNPFIVDAGGVEIVSEEEILVGWSLEPVLNGRAVTVVPGRGAGRAWVISADDLTYHQLDSVNSMRRKRTKKQDQACQRAETGMGNKSGRWTCCSRIECESSQAVNVG